MLTANARVEVDGGRRGVVLLGRDRMVVVVQTDATAAMHIRDRERAGSLLP